MRVVLEILRNEVKGRTKTALRKMAKDYSMTWVDMGVKGNKLFASTGKNIEKEMRDAYMIKGRRYEIKNIAEGKDLVMMELAESYPELKTKKIYRTPLVLVLEMKNGKIRTGRHYCDPRLSYKFLTRKQLEKAYKSKKRSLMVIR